MTTTEHENPVAQAHARAAAAAEAAAQAKRDEDEADRKVLEDAERVAAENAAKAEMLQAAPPVPEFDPVAASMEAPGHGIGDKIAMTREQMARLLSMVAVDTMGRLWRIDEDQIVLVGRLNG